MFLVDLVRVSYTVSSPGFGVVSVVGTPISTPIRVQTPTVLPVVIFVPDHVTPQIGVVTAVTR